MRVGRTGPGADGSPAASAPAVIADIAAARPDAVTTALRNDYVRVLRFDLAPGEALPGHRGGRRVVYALNDYQVAWTENGDALGQGRWSEGDVHVHGPGVHAIENTGENTASFVIVERLDAALPEAPVPTGAEALPAGARGLHAGEHFGVLNVELAPGEAQQDHPGGWRAIYALTGSTIEWRQDGNVSERSWRAGQAHWHAPGIHAAANTGETTARWLVVEIRD